MGAIVFHHELEQEIFEGHVDPEDEAGDCEDSSIHFKDFVQMVLTLRGRNSSSNTDLIVDLRDYLRQRLDRIEERQLAANPEQRSRASLRRGDSSAMRGPLRSATTGHNAIPGSALGESIPKSLT